MKNLATLLLLALFAFCQKNERNRETSLLLGEENTADPVEIAITDCGQLKTVSPGGWGAPPAGNNPGTYLHANFAAAFPGGLTVGCTAGYHLQLTSAQAVTNYLPAGGPPSALSENVIDPAGKQLKNTLANHIVTLTLNVVFDANDPNFAPSDVTLNEMIIGSGPFQHLTVAEFLSEANKVLGGCSNSITPQQVAETADSIIQNFLDGTVNNGFLVCPGMHD